MKIILLLCIFLIGCTHQIEVPVGIPRPIVILDEEPNLDIFKLTKKSSPSSVFKAYVVTYYQQKAYIAYLKSFINY